MEMSKSVGGIAVAIALTEVLPELPDASARGGLNGATYSWATIFATPSPAGGPIPGKGFHSLKDEVDDGWHGAAPVGCFAPNGYGLVDMAGNIWEYARDWYVPGHPAEPAREPQGPASAPAISASGRWPTRPVRTG